MTRTHPIRDSALVRFFLGPRDLADIYAEYYAGKCDICRTVSANGEDGLCYRCRALGPDRARAVWRRPSL